MRNPTVVPSDVPGHFSGPVVDPPKDPVCGMTVGPDSVFRHSHRNRTFVFCSEECLARFKANPVLYAGNDIPGPVTLVKFPQRAEGDTGTGTYTCPMHPEVVRDSPGSCPKCGMALELRTAVGGEGEQENSEFVDMRRRFLVSAFLTAPLFLVAMGDFIPGHPFEGLFPGSTLPWVEFLLATPVVLWGGWPFFVRGWHSVVNRSLNMFTLIALGVGVAYLYSLFAVLFPGIFPPSFRDAAGMVAVYFEAAAVIVTLVLLGQVLELKARSRTGADAEQRRSCMRPGGALTGSTRRCSPCALPPGGCSVPPSSRPPPSNGSRKSWYIRRRFSGPGRR